MNKTIHVFFVTAAEYPALQAACPDDFPFTYVEFASRVEQGIKAVSDPTVTVTKTYADVAEFLAWCREAKVKPDNVARAEFARLIGHRSSLQ